MDVDGTFFQRADYRPIEGCASFVGPRDVVILDSDGQALNLLRFDNVL